MFVLVVSSPDFSEYDLHFPFSYAWFQSKFTAGISQTIVWFYSLFVGQENCWCWCSGNVGALLGDGGEIGRGVAYIHARSFYNFSILWAHNIEFFATLIQFDIFPHLHPSISSGSSNYRLLTTDTLLVVFGWSGRWRLLHHAVRDCLDGWSSDPLATLLMNMHCLMAMWLQMSCMLKNDSLNLVFLILSDIYCDLNNGLNQPVHKCIYYIQMWLSKSPQFTAPQQQIHWYHNED